MPVTLELVYEFLFGQAGRNSELSKAAGGMN
jgi:hypothetical protein